MLEVNRLAWVVPPRTDEIPDQLRSDDEGRTRQRGSFFFSSWSPLDDIWLETALVHDTVLVLPKARGPGE